MPVILASLVFAISLSLLPYTEPQTDEAADMERLRSEYMNRKRRRSRMEDKASEETDLKILEAREGRRYMDERRLGFRCKSGSRPDEDDLPQYLTTRRRSVSLPHTPARPI